MKAGGRILNGVGSLIIFVCLLFTWGDSQWWSLLAKWVDKLNFFAPTFVWSQFFAALYILLPLITLIIGIGMTVTQKGYNYGIIFGGLNIIVIFINTFSGLGELISHLGGATTCVWVGVGAIFFGATMSVCCEKEASCCAKEAEKV